MHGASYLGGENKGFARGEVLIFRRPFAVALIALIALFTAITWTRSSWRGQLPGFSWFKVYQKTELTKARWAITLRETKHALQKAKRVITRAAIEDSLLQKIQLRTRPSDKVSSERFAAWHPSNWPCNRAPHGRL